MAHLTGVGLPGVTKTWQDVYESQPISEVRVLEKQLRSSISRDKEKLRILVGSNYRDLLSTADEIVSLESDSRATESSIAELSLICKPPELTTLVQNTLEHAVIAAEVHLLSRCLVCSKHLLRTRSTLLSAQLCLIARLLLKSLTDSSISPKIVGIFRAQAEDLRQDILRNIDAQFIHPRSSVKSMIDAICAFSLVKSVSSMDSIEHFCNLRLFKLEQRFAVESPESGYVKESFRYLVLSIQSLRSLLSRGVNDVLTTLQRQPILEGPTVSRMEALGLDAVRTLIPSDVLVFTPYVKRVVLQKSDINDAVQLWILKASEVASIGLARALHPVKETKDVLKLRKDLLNIVLPVYFSTNARGSLLQSVRDTTNKKLFELSQNQNEHVLQVVEDMLASSTHSTTSASIWDDSFVQRPLVTNSADFLKQVRSRHLGTKGSLERSLKRLRAWTRSFKLLQEELQEIQRVRWQDIIEEADEGEEEAFSKVVEDLSKIDPMELRSFVNSTIRRVVSRLENQLTEHVSNTLSKANYTISEVIFLLRVVRECSAVVGHAVSEHKLKLGDVYTKLHTALVKETLHKLSSKVEKRNALHRKSTASADGLPSPRCFSALRDLCLIMEEVGGVDIWSTQAVKILKVELQQTIFLEDNLRLYAEGEFDKHYLRSATGVSLPKDSKASDTTAELAHAYWQRTKLLFGSLGR